MPDTEPKPRWYHLTPDRFLIGLLAAEGLLLLVACLPASACVPPAAVRVNG